MIEIPVLPWQLVTKVGAVSVQQFAVSWASIKELANERKHTTMKVFVGEIK
jgi:hypothetical protein